MKPDNSSPAPGIDRFRTTQWSVVLLSAQSQAPGSEAALAELCRLYWYPLYGFVRRRGYNADDARDLTQGFFLHLLEHKTLTHIDPSKGKFRSFLLASLQKYLSLEATRARCLKRGGEIEFVFLDAKSAEDRYQLEPLDALTPEIIFDARWAMALLAEAKSRLAEEYAADGRSSTFETLKPFLDVENRKDPPSYETAANALRIGVGGGQESDSSPTETVYCLCPRGDRPHGPRRFGYRRRDPRPVRGVDRRRRTDLAVKPEAGEPVGALAQRGDWRSVKYAPARFAARSSRRLAMTSAVRSASCAGLRLSQSEAIEPVRSSIRTRPRFSKTPLSRTRVASKNMISLSGRRRNDRLS